MTGATPRSWPLVGREDEQARVLDAIGPGRGGILLAGAAGVGKSRLARESAAALDSRRLRVEWVLATHAAASIPLGAFAHLVADADAATVDDRLGLFNLVARRLQAAAGSGRLLLGVDDAHLLDPASAALVHFLVTRDVATVVATARTGEPWPDAITALWKDAHVARLDLQALAEAEVGTLLEAVLAGPVSRTCRGWAFERTDGNPLFLRELVVGALDAGTLTQENGLWWPPPTTEPPTYVGELVELRLADLAPAPRRALEVVALGEPVPIAALHRVVPATDVLTLEEAGLIVAHPGADGGVGAEVRLAHPLYGDVVRGRIPTLRAAEVRRSLADAVQHDAGRPADLLRVTTWRLAAGDAVDDAELLVAAAGEASRRFDPQLAGRLARLAVAAGGGLPAVLALADALRAQEDFVATDALLASIETEARDSPAAPHYLFLRVATLLWGLGRPERAAALLDTARAWRPDAGWGRVVTNLEVLVWSITGELDATAEAGLALLAQPDVPDRARVSTAVATGFALSYLGRGRDALVLLDEATATTGSASSEWPPDAMWAQVAIVSGLRWSEAGHRLSTLHTEALAAGNGAIAHWAELTIGWLELQRGRVTGARRWLGEAISGLEQADPRRLLATGLAYLAVVEAAAGRESDARAALARSVAARGERPVFWLSGPEHTEAEVWVAAVAGETSRAVGLALDEAERQRRSPPLAAEFLHLALRLGAEPTAIAPGLRGAADASDSPLVAAGATHAEALLTRTAADAESAARAFEAVGALARAAEAAADAALLHERSGRAASARTANAYSQALVARCTEARLPRLRTSTPVTLSRREREVATLAARGLTNAEIAGRLSLSVRTVESHVYRASTRLGVSRREDLAQLLGEQVR